MALQPQPMQQAQQQQTPQPQQGGGQQAEYSDEQMKQMFEQMAAPAIEYIYGNGLEDIKQVLTANANAPAQGIADIVGRMLSGMALQAREKGGMIPPKVMVAVAMELINNVSDIGLNIGMIDDQAVSDIAEEAFVLSLGVFGDTVEDLAISDSEAQSYMQIIDEMEQLMNAKGGQGEQADPNQQPQEEQGAPEAQPQQAQQATMAQAAVGA